jgi:hypothetical protein
MIWYYVQYQEGIFSRICRGGRVVKERRVLENVEDVVTEWGRD